MNIRMLAIMRLFEPKSLLPGNEILPAETKAPKWLRKTRQTVAET